MRNCKINQWKKYIKTRLYRIEVKLEKGVKFNDDLV